MAIEHKLLLKGHLFCINQVIDYCVEKCINFEVIDDNSIYLDDIGLKILFICEEETRVWQSEVYKVVFLYDEIIIFRLDKDCEMWEKQMDFVVNYVFNIMVEKKRDGMLIYNTDNEICYFKADGSTIVIDDFGIVNKFLMSKENIEH